MLDSNSTALYTYPERWTHSATPTALAELR